MIAIIGAGTAGLTARREVARVTDDYVLIDPGPLGTTCARVGCMPSKAFIQVANDFHRRHHWQKMGISGADQAAVNSVEVMNHVRRHRDRFTGGTVKGMQGFDDHLIRKKARFIDAHTLDLEGETHHADKIIIATGSAPFIPPNWKAFESHLITTDSLFELDKLPKSMAILGLGIIGLELGLALSRLGVKVVSLGRDSQLGGASDPLVLASIKKILEPELNFQFGEIEILGINSKNQLEVKCGGNIFSVDKALVAIGRRPRLLDLQLENAGIKFDSRGMPDYDPCNFSLKDAPHLFLAGDVNAHRPLLHEASDQGFITGFSAASNGESLPGFQTRTPLAVTFTEPQIASAGKRFVDLKAGEFVIGTSDFGNQGRAVMMNASGGLIQLYADAKSGLVLGAELFTAESEHMAHLLAWSIQQNQTVFDLLRMPFYHPVLEEGLRSAIRHAADQVKGQDGKRFLELKQIY